MPSLNTLKKYKKTKKYNSYYEHLKGILNLTCFQQASYLTASRQESSIKTYTGILSLRRTAEKSTSTLNLEHKEGLGSLPETRAGQGFQKKRRRHGWCRE